MKVRKITNDKLFAQNEIMSEDQIEGVLLGWFYRVTRTCDRRPDEMSEVNPAVGLPESPGALAPRHRAVYGTELAMGIVVPPEQWIKAAIYTDDLPENVGKPQDQKEWRSLAFKSPNDWSMDEVLSVKENTRRLKRVVHRLAGDGLFVTSPRIDDKERELGTDRLVHGDDEMTMGFTITYKGIQYAEAFAREHTRFMRGHTILDAVGESLASQIPEWKRAELRNADTYIDTSAT